MVCIPLWIVVGAGVLFALVVAALVGLVLWIAAAVLPPPW